MSPTQIKLYIYFKISNHHLIFKKLITSEKYFLKTSAALKVFQTPNQLLLVKKERMARKL